MGAGRIWSPSSPMLLLTPSQSIGIRSSPLRVGYLTSNATKVVTMSCSNNHLNNNIQACTSSSPNNNKIFEDRSAGIVCYRDENGEITCEGYDEGPRFHHKLSTFHFKSPTPTPTRDVEIIQLLQRCWLQVAEDED